MRLVLREHDALVDHLHRVVLLRHAVLREEHHPEAAGAEEAEELEVVDRRLRRRLELPRDERRVRARAQEARVDVVAQREDDVVEHRVEEVRVHRAAPRRRERRLDPRALEARDADGRTTDREACANRTPREIIDTPADFIAAIGLDDHLSPTRKNGLGAMLAAIKERAGQALAAA